MFKSAVNAANALTALRFVLTPIIIWAFCTGNALTAFVLFLIAASTDGLDGFVARRWNQKTRLGALMDPIADKFLMSSLILMSGFTPAANVPWLLVWIVIGRDLYLLIAGAFLVEFTAIRDFPPSGWGKASTFAQIVFVIFVMATCAFDVESVMGWYLESLVAVLSMMIVVFLAAKSASDYTVKGIRRLRAARLERAEIS